jgi:predicted nuclease of predicted toxin-antitoxin system
VKLLIDAQLPPALAPVLSQLGHDALHVRSVGLRSAADTAVWGYAVQEGAVILTKDEDFAARRLRESDGPVVVWLRVGNCSRAALIRWLLPLLGLIERMIDAGETLIEVR